MSALVDWLDLSAHGAKLSVLQFPDGKKYVVLTGVKDGSPSWRWAEENGYKPSPNRLALFSENTQVSFSKFLAHFTQGKRTKTPINEVIRVAARDNVRTVQNTKTELELRGVRVLGLNYHGQMVYEGATGRFVRPDEGNQSINESESQAGLFLRASTPEDLALCADGFVESMARGEFMKSMDLRKFASVVYDMRDVMEASDVRLRGVQEAVEAAMQRRLESAVGVPGAEAFALAVDLTERQPPMVFRTSSSIDNQQYSSPLPLGIAVQYMAGDTSGKTVLEPTIGNASLVSILPAGTQITGYDIDPVRVQQSARVARADLTVKEADFTKLYLEPDQRFDVVVANPPFGGLFPTEEIQGLRVSRLDHLILLKSLLARADNGRAIYVIGADRDNMFDKNAGQISGGSKNLFNWLTDHYEVEGVAEIDGRLYEKQGAGVPVRVVVVGARRSPEAIEAAQRSKAHRLEGKLPVLRSWSAVWEFAEAHTPARDVVVTAEQTTAVDAPVGRSENGYQAPYTAASKVAEASAMIPRNMLAPVSAALDALEDIYGGVDEYVANKLRMTLTDLGVAFSPEQVDALALAIARVDEGRGFIVGDQTGLGKGRIMAGMARYAALEGRHLLFLTEKPNLFSDLWRDICDISVDMDPRSLFRPFILNDGVSIRGADNHVVFPATRTETVRKLLDDAIHPEAEGYTISFATYSQFNRELAKSPKASWLGLAATDSLVLLDESHNASGASNTAANIAGAVNRAWGCVYSSATYAKNAKSMAAYSKVFPPTVSPSELPDILAAGGEALQEILSANLAEDGVMIRREHDLSALTFETRHDVEHLERNRDLSDRLSSILLSMSYMAGDVARMAERLDREMREEFKKLGDEQRKGARMGVTSMNFGSRLYNILRQFQLAINVDITVDEAVRALREGRKPVIVTEQTMESLLMETLFDRDVDDPEDGNAPVLRETHLPQLTFRDVLYRVLNRLDIIVERNDYGSVTRTSALEKAETKEEREGWMRAKSRIRTMIDAFPDLAVSPLDRIRQKIEDAGFSCGEISGRKWQLREVPVVNHDGIGVAVQMVVQPRPDDRLKTIHGFNNGTCDAVLLTRAGSTGISLHSSEKFDDQRQREMLELQIANNVAERMQFFGRVNRKGQTSAPIIKTISSGLPAEVRLLAMQNAKLARLSANTQSNRDNAASSKEIPDLINKLGNDIAFRFLENNPSVGQRLDIRLDDEQLVEDDGFYINRLMARLALLPVSEQEEILELISDEFDITLAELERNGENPFKLTENNWGARVVSRELFDGAEDAGGSVFERPVYLTTLEWFEEVTPMPWSEVESRIMHQTQEMLRDGRVSLREGVTLNGFPVLDFEKAIQDIDQAFARIIEEALPDCLSEARGIRTLEDVLALDSPNSVKSAVERRSTLIAALDALRPGRLIRMTNAMEGSAEGVVISLTLPEEVRHAHLLGAYEVAVAVPGETKPQRHTVFALSKRDYEWNVLPQDMRLSYRDELARRFDQAPAGKLARQRVVLDGNLFRAAQLAAQMDMGRSGIYVDEHGVRQRAIILNNAASQASVRSVPVRIPTAAVAAALLRTTQTRVELSTSSKLIAPDATLVRSVNGEFVIVAPGTKTHGGRVFLNADLRALVGDFAGGRSQMRATVGADQLEKALRILMRECGGLYVPSTFRDRVNQLQAVQADTPKVSASQMSFAA